MAIRIGIVGFGRIGRALYRLGYNRPGVEFVVICDAAEPESLAYLLNNSTVEGPFEAQARLEGNHLACGVQRSRLLRETEPGMIPWDCFGVDLVLECTGCHRERADLELHLGAGAARVLLSTPAADSVDRTVVLGINDREVTGRERIVSCGSSSVHALALIAKILHEAGTIESASMTTVHAYTGDQQLSDMAKAGLRWSRSAAQNIIPNRTWAPGVVTELLPELAGRLDGIALNVPVAAGSNIDLVAKLGKPLTAGEVNGAVRAAAEGPLRGLVEYTEELIVSSDVVGNTCSALFDASATMVLPGGLVKTLTWFDNGWAYAARMLETAELLAARAEGGGK